MKWQNHSLTMKCFVHNIHEAKFQFHLSNCSRNSIIDIHSTHTRVFVLIPLYTERYSVLFVYLLISTDQTDSDISVMKHNSQFGKSHSTIWHPYYINWHNVVYSGSDMPQSDDPCNFYFSTFVSSPQCQWTHIHSNYYAPTDINVIYVLWLFHDIHLPYVYKTSILWLPLAKFLHQLNWFVPFLR